jgi:hypothetical protein
MIFPPRRALSVTYRIEAREVVMLVVDIGGRPRYRVMVEIRMRTNEAG